MRRVRVASKKGKTDWSGLRKLAEKFGVMLENE